MYCAVNNTSSATWQLFWALPVLFWRNFHSVWLGPNLCGLSERAIIAEHSRISQPYGKVSHSRVPKGPSKAAFQNGSSGFDSRSGQIGDIVCNWSPQTLLWEPCMLYSLSTGMLSRRARNKILGHKGLIKNLNMAAGRPSVNPSKGPSSPKKGLRGWFSELGALQVPQTQIFNRRFSVKGNHNS